MIEYLNIDENKNVYVVGDIHGEYGQLIEKLKEFGFDFKNDLLIAVGDLVDRGKQNTKCVELLDKSWFKSVMGNHEDFCIQGINNNSVSFYHKMQNNGGAWFYELDEITQQNIAERFRQLPILIELLYRNKKYGFVHADVPVEDWDLLKEMISCNDDINGRSIVDQCLWSRRIVNLDTVCVANIDRVFLGHTVLPEIKEIGNCTFLDTGAVFKEFDSNYKLSIIKI